MALKAYKAQQGPQGIQGPAGIGVTIHKKGDSYQGGIIFYVSADGQHGLIAARADQGSAPWNNGNFGIVGTSGDGLFAGAMNTTIEVATQIRDAPLANFAALLAANYSIHDDGITACSGSTTETCYGDWYLPSKQELKWLYQESKVVGGFVNYNNSYWSSTEYDQTMRGIRTSTMASSTPTSIRAMSLGCVLFGLFNNLTL